MKLHAALCLLVFAGCATTPQSLGGQDVAHGAEEGGGGPAGSLQEAEPVRLRTPAGTFLVSPQHADDFAKALAGQETPTRFYAGADHP